MKAMGGNGGNGGTLGVCPRTHLPSETRRTTQVDRSRDATIREEERGGESSIIRAEENEVRTGTLHILRIPTHHHQIKTTNNKQQTYQDSVAERSKALE